MPQAPTHSPGAEATIAEVITPGPMTHLRQGLVIDVGGVRLRLTSVNAGKQRYTFEPVYRGRVPAADSSTTGRVMGPGRAEDARQKRLASARMEKRRAHADAKREAKGKGRAGQ